MRYDCEAGMDGVPRAKGHFLPAASGWPTATSCRDAMPRPALCSSLRRTAQTHEAIARTQVYSRLPDSARLLDRLGLTVRPGVPAASECPPLCG